MLPAILRYMQKFILVAVGVFIGGVVGLFISQAFVAPEQNVVMSTEMDGHSHADGHTHDHSAPAVVNVSPAPSIVLDAILDSKSGYNLRLITENFTFTPEVVGGESVQGQGHAHVYVNGNKIARVYGEWIHIPAEELKAGENIISATLNADNHSEWQVANESVQAEIMVMQ
jgi:hypothetical protein